LSSHQDCKKLTNITLTLLLYIRQVGILHIDSQTIRIDLYYRDGLKFILK